MHGLLTKYGAGPFLPRMLNAAKPYSTLVGLGVGGAAGAGTYALTGDPTEAGAIGTAAGIMLRPGLLQAKYRKGVNSAPVGSTPHESGLEALGHHLAYGIGGKAVLAGGLVGAHQLPKMLDRANATLQNVQDTTGNIKRLTGDIATPGEELTTADGGRVALSPEEAAALKKLAPKTTTAPRDVAKLYGKDVSSGKAKLTTVPSGAAALQAGARALGETGQNAAGKITDMTTNLANATGDVSRAAAGVPKLLDTVGDAAKNVGKLNQTMERGIGVADKNLSSVGKALNTGAEAVAGVADWGKQNAPWLIGGGMTAAGLYALAQWYKSHDEETRRREAAGRP